MATTIRLTPDSDHIRMCARHPDRKATAFRVSKLAAQGKLPPQTQVRPVCPECANRPLAKGEKLRKV